jgi:hypothetical protein
MITEGSYSLSSEDITSNTASRVLRYGKLLDDAVAMRLRLPYVNENALKVQGGAAAHYTHYLWQHGFGCS